MRERDHMQQSGQDTAVLAFALRQLPAVKFIEIESILLRKRVRDHAPERLCPHPATTRLTQMVLAAVSVTGIRLKEFLVHETQNGIYGSARTIGAAVHVFDIDPTPFGSLELLQVVSGTRSTLGE